MTENVSYMSFDTQNLKNTFENKKTFILQFADLNERT